MKLDKVVPWGRSFDEYARMFALTDGDLDSRIIACADGPASFNAEMAADGRKVISVDPLYTFDADAIRKRIAETYETVLREASKSREIFVWREIRSVEELGRLRMAAMETFLADYASGGCDGRYVAAALPELPFARTTFDLALCSHFLFTYSKQLSLEFHLGAVEEMCRVAAEARVFPLLDAPGTPSPHLVPLCDRLRKRGHSVSIVRVPYEFQVGGDEMMAVRRGG
jgi:hypothetical protein